MSESEELLEAALKAQRVAAIAAQLDRLDDDARLGLIEVACARVARLDDAGFHPDLYVAVQLIGQLLRALVAPTPRHLEAVAALLARDGDADLVDGYGDLPAAIVACAERAVAAGHQAALQPTLVALRPLFAPLKRKKEGRQLLTRLEALLGQAAVQGPEAGERWAEAALADLATLSVAERAAWLLLWQQAEGATAARPSARWQTRSAERVTAIGRAQFIARLAAWLPLVEKPKTLRQVGFALQPPISDRNTRTLTALAWMLGGGGEAEAARLLGDLAALCFSKIAGFGPVSAKVGNACVWALGAMPGLEGVAQLSRLRLRVKYAVAQRLIARSLDEAARRAGLSVADVEELAVPTFGLDREAQRKERLGDSGWTAEVTLGRRGAVVTFAHPDKRAPKSVPAEVKALPEWKELKKSVAALDQCLAVERARLEGYYLARRELPLGELRARAFNHPVVGQVARRLLWSVAAPGQPTRTTRYHNGQLVDLGNEPITDEDARVSLWHPLGVPRDEVAVWQDLLEHEGVVQPWKQAHREVYSLGRDEQRQRQSTRFAGHIVRQHQFAALANARGWRFRLMGAFDSHNTPVLALPSWDLEAHLDVDFPAAAEEEVSGAGIYLHIRTGALELHRNDAPLPLDDVPPLLLSEILRDVDLLVSVSSIASDPAWRLRDGHRFNDYWRDAALGPLGPVAEVRRDVIARLLPRLPDGARLAVDDRFVTVQGKRRRYRVHLGSGMVLLDPTQQPIVVARPPALALALPFDGDALLETILETVLALLEDDRIRDPEFRAAIGA